MSVEITTLPSGLTVVTDAMPHLETASLGVWVGAGSRDELFQARKRKARFAIDQRNPTDAVDVIKKVQHVNAASELDGGKLHKINRSSGRVRGGEEVAEGAHHRRPPPPRRNDWPLRAVSGPWPRQNR